ncbi:MAG: AAA family ATPase [Prevotella sp.]
MEQQRRKYPVGIQTFSEIIKEGYIYVDKTDLVWQLAHYAKFIFMSRPRRFGKSLLTSTLDSYWRGDKDLFKGLKIMDLEKEWKNYPVIHLDLSIVKGRKDADDLQRAICWMLSRLDCFERNEYEKTPGEILDGMIRRLSREGRQVVVIVDEYDAPLLEVLHEKEILNGMRKVMQEFYMPLKANEAIIKFCFITGITKFSQLSIFSTINNLTNVTLDPKFSAICGITENELCTTLWQDVAMLSEVYKESPEAMHQRLKLRYDGYHFSENSPEVYNPFSLLKAFLMQKIDNYWFESGTPTFLIQQMKHFKTDITSLDKLEVMSSAFDQPTENMEDALPLLYQSGYLTIKDFDMASGVYTLSIPNQEVRVGYVSGLLPSYIGLKSSDVQMSFAYKFWNALRNGDINLALEHMQAYLAGIPYVEGFKQKLAEAATAEGFWEYTFYLIFSMLNSFVRTQVKVAGGRADMVVFMPDTIYIIELKAGGSAEQALQQIETKGYAKPYLTDGRKIVKVGVNVDKDTRTIEDWKIS